MYHPMIYYVKRDEMNDAIKGFENLLLFNNIVPYKFNES